MDLAVIFSERKEYTEADPLKIRLEEGVHEIMGNGKVLNVTCNHITFVGQGKERTTICGRLKVENQQRVTFAELAVASPRGPGFELRGSETTVDLVKCAVKECRCTGMHVKRGAGVTAIQCEFTKNGGNGVFCAGANTNARLHDCTVHHNELNGLHACDRARVDLGGTNMEIHSNKRSGIRAHCCAKVNIHLPSQHNTSHDNVGEDRHQERGGSIANINADGTFTHVVAEEEDDEH
jgi:hypothetical protein